MIDGGAEGQQRTNKDELLSESLAWSDAARSLVLRGEGEKDVGGCGKTEPRGMVGKGREGEKVRAKRQADRRRYICIQARKRLGDARHSYQAGGRSVILVA